jgi:methionine sulfoxide reductase heme-binding subunit
VRIFVTNLTKRKQNTMKKVYFLIFRIHDLLANFFARNVKKIKQTILIIAHLSLFGFFFPDLRKDYGELAGNLLIFILFLSPLSRIFRIRFLLQLMSIRRELGILMAYLAIVHGVGYMIDPDWFQSLILPTLSVWQNGFLFGMVAFALTLPLLLTSNNLALKYLGGKKWKWLHRTIYILFVFAVLHRFFIKTKNDTDTLFAFAQASILIGTYILLKILAWKNFLPPLVAIIAYFERLHVEYQAQ